MKNILTLSALNGFLVVALGAFGAHGLESLLSPERLETWQTGIHYHMFHTLAMFGTGLLNGLTPGSKRLGWVANLFLGGIILFSGSLYLLALTGVSILGMITPLGGLSFLAGWALLFVDALNARHD